ncbi:hypothetical protein GTA08_BOTSDO03972 [Neofusicoccum parvum]|nr:hypothetical protein GTA08_BOTSDO03972 [Neofusicoccum parvum]
MEQLTPDLSTAYHALLTEIHSPQKGFAEPVWSPLESNYLDDSDSSSVESDETVVGGFDQSFLRPSPPPPSPDMDQQRLFSQKADTQPKISDTPSTTPLFVILDMLDIMLEQAQAPEPKERPKPTRANTTSHETESDLETGCEQVVQSSEPSSGLGPTQLMQMIDILMTRWPTVESAVLTTLHQNPGANIHKYIQLLGKVLLNRVSGPAK